MKTESEHAAPVERAQPISNGIKMTLDANNHEVPVVYAGLPEHIRSLIDSAELSVDRERHET